MNVCPGLHAARSRPVERGARRSSRHSCRSLVDRRPRCVRGRVESFVLPGRKRQLARLDPRTMRAGGMSSCSRDDQRNGRPVELAFDTGRPINAAALLSKLAAARAKRRGKYDDALYRRLATERASGRIKVAVWLRYDERLPRKTTRASKPSRKRSLALVERSRRRRAAMDDGPRFSRLTKVAPPPPGAEGRFTPGANGRLTKRTARVTRRRAGGGIFLAPERPVDDFGLAPKSRGRPAISAERRVRCAGRRLGARTRFQRQKTTAAFFDTAQQRRDARPDEKGSTRTRREKTQGYPRAAPFFGQQLDARARLGRGQRNCTSSVRASRRREQKSDAHRSWTSGNGRVHPHTTIVRLGNGTRGVLNHKSSTPHVGSTTTRQPAPAGNTVSQPGVTARRPRAYRDAATHGVSVSAGDSGTRFAGACGLPGRGWAGCR